MPAADVGIWVSTKSTGRLTVSEHNLEQLWKMSVQKLDFWMTVSFNKTTAPKQRFFCEIQLLYKF